MPSCLRPRLRFAKGQPLGPKPMRPSRKRNLAQSCLSEVSSKEEHYYYLYFCIGISRGGECLGFVYTQKTKISP